MTDFLGFGKEKRRQGNFDVLAERKTFRCVRLLLKQRAALCSVTVHRYVNILIKAEYRDSFKEMLDSVSEKNSFEHCKDVLRESQLYCLRSNPRIYSSGFVSPCIDIDLDSGFKDFYKWCKENDIPIVIVSSGMTPIIRAVLSKHIGEEEAQTVDIISNDVNLKADGSWEIQYRHPSR